MLLESIRAKGFGPYREEIYVNLAELPGRLIAVTGRNGQGKSIFLELLVGGALYRETPTRGSLPKLATDPNAYLEVTIKTNERWRIRQTVGGAPEGKSSVQDERGQPVLEKASVPQFFEWSAKNLPPRDVVFASAFAAQGTKGFLGMRPAERRSIILSILGIERLELLASRARKRAADAASALDIVVARLRDEEARAGDPAEWEQIIEHERRVLAEALPRITAGRAAVEQARTQWQEHRLATSRRDELIARWRLLESQVTTLQQRVANNRLVLSEAEDIRAAEDRAGALDAELAELTQVHDAATQAASAGRVVLRSHERQIAALHGQMSREGERRDRALARGRDRDAIAAATRDLPGVQEALRAVTSRSEDAAKEISRTQSERFGLAERRIEGMHGSLTAIASCMHEPEVEAWKALERDRELVDLALSSPEREGQLTKQAEAARAELSGLAARERELSTLAARGPDVAAADQDVAEAQREIERLQSQLDSTHTAVAIAEEGLRLDEERRRRAADSLAVVQQDRSVLDGSLAKVGALANAEARLAELEPQLAERTRELVAVEASLREMGEISAPRANLASLSAALDTLESKARATERQLAVAETRLAQSIQARQRIVELRAERTRVEADLADWTRLGEDLGRHGLQSLEIDSVGPELTAVCNDLLHTSVGPRWTTVFDAANDCVLQVLDVEAGREAVPESLCGGEKVTVGEAIFLALLILDCRRRGWQECTIVRDESGAALDPESARCYIQMLRRAADLAGARQVLFVTHNKEIQELADVCLDVANGRVTVSEQQNAA